MDIPHELLDLADKESEAYKEYIGLASAFMESSKSSGPAPEAHRNLETNAKLRSEEERKKKKVDRGGKKLMQILKLDEKWIPGMKCK